MHPALKFCDILNKSGTRRLAISGNQPGIPVAKTQIWENRHFLGLPSSIEQMWIMYQKKMPQEGLAFFNFYNVFETETRTTLGWKEYTWTGPTPRRSSGTPYHQTSRRNRPSKNLEPQLFKTVVLNGAKCVPDDLMNLWCSNLKDARNAYFENSWTSSRARWWHETRMIKYANNLQRPTDLCRIVLPLEIEINLERYFKILLHNSASPRHMHSYYKPLQTPIAWWPIVALHVSGITVIPTNSASESKFEHHAITAKALCTIAKFPVALNVGAM